MNRSPESSGHRKETDMKRLVVLALAGALAVPLLCGCPKKKAKQTEVNKADQEMMKEMMQKNMQKGGQ